MKRRYRGKIIFLSAMSVVMVQFIHKIYVRSFLYCTPNYVFSPAFIYFMSLSAIFLPVAIFYMLQLVSMLRFTSLKCYLKCMSYFIVQKTELLPINKFQNFMLFIKMIRCESIIVKAYKEKKKKRKFQTFYLGRKYKTDF